MANIDRFFICSWACMRLRLNLSIFLLLTCSYTHSDSIGLPGGCSRVGRRLSSFACWNIHRSFTFKVFLCIIMCLTVVFIATMCYFGEWGCSIRLKNIDDWWLTRSIWSKPMSEVGLVGVLQLIRTGCMFSPCLRSPLWMRSQSYIVKNCVFINSQI